MDAIRLMGYMTTLTLTRHKLGRDPYCILMLRSKVGSTVPHCYIRGLRNQNPSLVVLRLSAFLPKTKSQKK